MIGINLSEGRHRPKSKATIRLLMAAVALIAITMVSTYVKNIETRQATAVVTHTHEVIEAAHDFVNSIGAAEALNRDLILSSDSSLLPLYGSATLRVDTLLQRIHLLTLDNPEQTQIIQGRLIPFFHAQSALWNGRLEAKDISRQELLTMHTNKARNRFLDSLYVHSKIFIHNEELLTVKQNELLRRNYRTGDMIKFTFLSLIGLICIAAIITIRTQHKQNDQLVESLHEANASLESRIAARTAELDKRNKELEVSLGEIKELYDHAPFGYHTVDSSGTIIKVNQTELKWLGYTEEEVVGKKTSQLLTKDSTEKRKIHIEALMKTGHLENLEFDFVRKDGSTFPVLMNTVAYFDADGKYINHRSSIFDISQRKELEQKLMELNMHLMHTNEEKNRFMGMATHDLRNPLNSIMGLLSLLKYPGNLNDEQQEYLNLIASSVAKMKALINKLLDLNRIEQSGAIVFVQRIDLRKQLHTILSSFETQAAKKNIQLLLDYQLDKNETETDPALLEQVIDNLLSNAIKFSRFEKKIWLRASENSDGDLIIEVEDQGPGIRPDEVHKLFGTFQRLSAQPTAGEPSTGLGLSIVKAIVKSLNGDITVDSTPGKGSCFKVTLHSHVYQAVGRPDNQLGNN